MACSDAYGSLYLFRFARIISLPASKQDEPQALFILRRPAAAQHAVAAGKEGQRKTYH
jgi:hypothetical protein